MASLLRLKGKGDGQSKRKSKVLAKTGQVERERLNGRLSERAR